MQWTYNNQPITDVPDGYVGFVYLITNLLTGKMYIGKKIFFFSKTTTRTVTLKNGTKKKKKSKSKVPSDWQEYYGSNTELLKDVESLGSDKFKREILFLCKSKAECSYIEAREQFSRRVLESKEYYNNQISVRIHGSHIITLYGNT